MESKPYHWRLHVEDNFTFLKTVTEVRRIIESEAARLAASRASQAEVSTMKLLMEQMVNILSDDASYVYEKYLDIDIQKESLPFHVAIVDGISRKDSETAYSASQQMFDDEWRYITGD